MAHKHFFVSSEKAIGALPAWLAGIHCNTYSHDGGTKISVGYLRGRRYSYSGSIIIEDNQLFDRALETVRSALSIGKGN